MEHTARQIAEKGANIQAKPGRRRIQGGSIIIAAAGTGDCPALP